MVADNTPRGVCPVELHAAVFAARMSGDGGGLCWSLAEWRRILDRLTPRQARVVYHHVLLGLTITEAAERMHISRGSADAAFRRALDRIRDALPADG